MNPLERDTSPAQLEEYYRLLRQLTPAQRLHVASEASRRLRTLAEAGIRMRHPELSEHGVRVALVRLRYGDEVARRLFPTPWS